MTADPSLVSRIQALVERIRKLKCYDATDVAVAAYAEQSGARYVHANTLHMLLADLDAALVIDPLSLQKKDETKNEEVLSRVAPLTAGADGQDLPRKVPPGEVAADERTD